MVTVNTESIGATGRDRADLLAHEAALPANLVSGDTQEIGEQYNDSELTYTSTITYSGHVTDATRNIIIRAASGEGFVDTGDGVAYRYNASNGAANRKTNNYNVMLAIEGSVNFMTVTGLQFKHDGPNQESTIKARGDNNIIIDNIIEGPGNYGSNAGVLNLENDALSVNNLVVVTTSGGMGISLGAYYGGNSTSVNDTVIKPSDLASGGIGVNENAGASNVVKGSLVLGFATGFNGTFAAASDYNVTDDSTAPGGNSTTSVTFADQIANTVEATLDARLLTGADALDAATQFTETNDLDAFGNARSVTTPNAGSYEGTPFTPPVPESDGDFFTQHIQDDIARTGGTNTAFVDVGSLNDVVEIANNNRRTHGGDDGSASNLEGDDLAGARQLTGVGTLTYFRESASKVANMRFNTTLLEYQGPASGVNEMIVRGRFAIALNGTTNSTTQALTGVSNADDCIPFVTGILNNSSGDDTDSATCNVWLSSSTVLEIEKGSNANNVTIYITVVEFTGSNWTVLHGVSSLTGADTGSITLRDGSDGTGTATNVSAWAEAVMFGQFRSDDNVSGTDDGIADNWPIYDVGTGLQTVDWTFDTDHASVNSRNKHFVHVLNHADLAVTRFSANTSSTAGETTIDITSASLTNVNEAMIVGSSISSGTGIALGRGYRNYYLNSATEAAHWCHRSGNTMAHEIQIVDFDGIVTAAPGGATPLMALLGVGE